MNKMRKLVSLLLSLALLLGACALAEEPAAAPVVPDLNATDVLATVGDASITWADAQPAFNSLLMQYGSSYDMADAANVYLFRAVALESLIAENVLGQKAKEFGLELTEDEVAQNLAKADSDWEAAIADYIASNRTDITDESSDEDKAAARAEAEQFYNDSGWFVETLREDYQKYALLDKVQAMMVQDATVTDEEVEAEYQRLVAADKELYENDLAAYADYNTYVEQMNMYAAMYGMGSQMDHAWYKPAGYRAVKHILLPVDETLMTAYTDLQARWEEQQDMAAMVDEVNEANGTDVKADEPEDPVTEQQINEAKAAIFASQAEVIDAINQDLANGEDFDELIALYGINADGTPSDPGMVNEPYKTSGYEVCGASTNYVPEFVEAAMSVENVGDVSAPYLSNFGIHIVKYIADVPGGPVPMTDAERQMKRANLLAARQSDLYATTMQQWIDGMNIVYTGVTPSMAELEAQQASDAVSEDVAGEMVDTQE